MVRTSRSRTRRTAKKLEPPLFKLGDVVVPHIDLMTASQDFNASTPASAGQDSAPKNSPNNIVLQEWIETVPQTALQKVRLWHRFVNVFPHDGDPSLPLALLHVRGSAAWGSPVPCPNNGGAGRGGGWLLVRLRFRELALRKISCPFL